MLTGILCHLQSLIVYAQPSGLQVTLNTETPSQSWSHHTHLSVCYECRIGGEWRKPKPWTRYCLIYMFYHFEMVDVVVVYIIDPALSSTHAKKTAGGAYLKFLQHYWIVIVRLMGPAVDIYLFSFLEPDLQNFSNKMHAQKILIPCVKGLEWFDSYVHKRLSLYIGWRRFIGIAKTYLAPIRHGS